MKHLMVTAAVALSLGAGSSFAETVNWGQHDTLESADFVTRSGSSVFSDTYNFSLSTTSDLSARVSELNAFGLDIAFTQLTLYKDDHDSNTADAAMTSFSYNVSLNKWIGTANGLLAGDYYYVIGGVTSAVGGVYNLSSAVTPVPEPESLALMLAGLGALGLSGRRRRAR